LVTLYLLIFVYVAQKCLFAYECQMALCAGFVALVALRSCYRLMPSPLCTQLLDCETSAMKLKGCTIRQGRNLKNEIFNL